MPEYQTFLDGGNLTTLWRNVRWLLFFVAPIVMIMFAFFSVEHLIDIIKKGTGQKTSEDHEDYDVYRY